MIEFSEQMNRNSGKFLQIYFVDTQVQKPYVSYEKQVQLTWTARQRKHLWNSATWPQNVLL